MKTIRRKKRAIESNWIENVQFIHSYQVEIMSMHWKMVKINKSLNDFRSFFLITESRESLASYRKNSVAKPLKLYSFSISIQTIHNCNALKKVTICYVVIGIVVCFLFFVYNNILVSMTYESNENI